MNSPAPDPDPRFEEALSGFRRAPLPPEWREDLLDKALPSQTRAPGDFGTHRGLFRLTRADRSLAAGLALAWFVIGVLWVTSPDEPASSSAERSTLGNPSVPIEEWPMFAWRTRNPLNLEAVFAP